VKFEVKYFKGLVFCAIRFTRNMTGHLRAWNDGNIRHVIMKQAMDNVLSKINVVNPHKMEIYDFPLCDSMRQPKVVF
jgi:hypothetical protein